MTKNVVAFDLYNKDNNLLIIFNNVNTESSLQKEFIYTINLKEMSKPKTWDITQYLINKNIDYVAKEFDNVGLKKTAKALPYIIGGVITLGLSFIVFFVLKKYMNYKKLQKEVTVKDKKDKKK
ncbi:hypothetical protein JTY60_02035 [symbiont of Argiope bruennichi]|uniref:hypothetical protein n=1 Tax=symbiont of Argiope bruennichi TaxID=2810479 RepID=UPI003DA30D98